MSNKNFYWAIMAVAAAGCSQGESDGQAGTDDQAPAQSDTEARESSAASPDTAQPQPAKAEGEVEQPSPVHQKFVDEIGKDLIIFQQGTADLQDNGRADGAITLIRMQTWFRENPGLKIRLEGRMTERIRRSYGEEHAKRLAQARLDRVSESLFEPIAAGRGEIVETANLWWKAYGVNPFPRQTS